jgi:thioredoxin reductase (NADPH)
VSHLRANGLNRILTLSDGTEITAHAVVIAPGAAYRRLDIPQLERFKGMGVFYTALSFDTPSDARLMKDKTVMVVGAGNAAGQAVVHLSKKARRVILIVRGDSLGTRMSDYLVRDISRRPNVEIRLRTEVVDGSEDSALQRVVLLDQARGTRETVPADALFALIGAASYRVAWCYVAARPERFHHHRSGPRPSRRELEPRARTPTTRDEHAGRFRRRP